MADDRDDEIDLWKEILRPLMRRVKAMVRVALPGVVQVFNATTRYVTVEWKSPFRVGLKSVEDEPITQQVPVWMPRGDGYGRHQDVAAGDNVFVVFADRDQNRFWLDGQTEPPQTASTHNLSYGMAFPGGRQSNEGSVNTLGTCQDGAEDGSATTIWTRARGANSGTWRGQATGECQLEAPTIRGTATAEVELEAPTIRLGADADSPIARATDLISAIDSALAAGVGGAVPNDGGTAAFTAAQSAWDAAKAAISAQKGEVK